MAFVRGKWAAEVRGQEHGLKGGLLASYIMDWERTWEFDWEIAEEGNHLSSLLNYGHPATSGVYTAYVYIQYLWSSRAIDV